MQSIARVIFLIHESKRRQHASRCKAAVVKKIRKKWPFPGAKQIFATATCFEWMLDAPLCFNRL